MKKVIAIDGPAGAGKSTIARRVAEKLGIIYIDTGAMYRAAALKSLQTLNLAECSDDDIAAAAEKLDIRLSYQGGIMQISSDGEDVTAEIRTPEVTAIVSRVAAIPRVRWKMVELQRQMAEAGGVVMDGRDIASKVLPNADLKIYLDADVRERARRRAKQLAKRGFPADIDKIAAEIAARDKADSERAESPLVRVPEAVLVDTTNMSLEEVEATILELAK